jgi:hypothetical protein
MHGGGHGFGHGHHGGHYGHGWGHRHRHFGSFYVGGSCWRTVWSDFGPRRVYVCGRVL